MLHLNALNVRLTERPPGEIVFLHLTKQCEALRVRRASRQQLPRLSVLPRDTLTCSNDGNPRAVHDCEITVIASGGPACAGAAQKSVKSRPTSFCHHAAASVQ